MDKKLIKQFLQFQQDEMDGYKIYWTLGTHAKQVENGKILTEMANVELNHANLIKKYTQKTLKPNWIKVAFYRLMSWLFGFTFVLKMLENDEGLAKDVYKDYPELMAFSKEEEKHEEQLIGLINEKRLKYIGS